MEAIYDLIIVGAGPAGSAAAITAARSGVRVLLLERGNFPRHKVCGEFVSPESLRLLKSLVAQEALLENAPRIGHVRLLIGGRVLETVLSPAAAGITRYNLDLALWKAAAASGAACIQGAAVSNISCISTSQFLVSATGGDYQARAVIDASGRWSNVGSQERPQPSESWVGLKAHFDAEESAASVDLYFSPEGYCGVQPIAGGRLNACAMVRASAVEGKTLDRVFALHPELWQRSRGWTASTPMVATSPLFFRRPTPLRDQILCAGDAAGFVDPFIGDGISLALHSGTLAAGLLTRFNLGEAARLYAETYRRQFLPVFRNSARIRALLGLPEPFRSAFSAAAQVPGVMRYFLSRTRLLAG